MSTDQLYAWGGGAAAVIAGAHAYVQSLVASRAKKEVKEVTEKAEQHLVSAAVSEQHKATAEAMERQANDWRARCIQNDGDWKKQVEKDRAEFAEQRQYWHDKAKEDQALLLHCQLETAELKGKTDLTPLVEYLKHRSVIDDQILSTLKGFSDSLTRVHERLDNLIDKKQPET